jgi:hypothetical protein
MPNALLKARATCVGRAPIRSAATAYVIAAGGSLINRWIASPRAHRLLSLGLAAILALSVLYGWV